MAGSKVSALTDGGTPQAGDLVHVARSGTDVSVDLADLTTTLAGTGTYISIAGQVITVDPITESDIADLGAYITGITGSPLSDLSDVTIATPATGEVLVWNGSAWINQTLAEAGVAAVGHTHDPATDIELGGATAGQQLTVNEDEDALVYGLASKYLLVRKATQGTIAAGRPVYIDSYNNAGYVEVEEADASSAATMPAVGVTYDAVTQGGSGSRVLLSGLFVGINTAGYADGAPLYVSTTAGELTDTKPAGNAQIQKIGQVGRGNINGQLVVSGAGRSNDTPNFTAADKYWYGGTGGVTTEGDITAAARTVLNDASVGAMVDTLGGAPSTGTGGLVRATSPTLVTPVLGTPQSGDISACTGTAASLTAGNVTTIPALSGDVSNTDNAVSVDALGTTGASVDVSAAAPPTTGQVLKATGATTATWQAESGGAPEGTAVLSTGEVGGIKFLREDGDNTCSWQSIPGGDALTSSPLSQFAATTSAQLAGVLSDETGNGAAVFATSPTLVTPDIGTPSAATLTNATGYPGDSSLVTTGAIDSGSITSGFGSIDNGASAITTTGVITGGTIEATADTSAADAAAIGYTATEGVIVTGQGSTNDVTVKNDADATVISIPTGTTTVAVAGNLELGHPTDTTIARSAAGAVTVEGSQVILANTTTYHQVYINAGAMIPFTTAGATAETLTFTTAGDDIMIDTMAFGTATESGCGFWWTPPEGWNAGTVQVKFHHTTETGTVTGTIKYDIAAQSYANSDAIDQALGTEQSPGAEATVTLKDMQITAKLSAALTIADATAGEPVWFEVTRDVATDTFDDDAHLIGVVIEYGVTTQIASAW